MQSRRDNDVQTEDVLVPESMCAFIQISSHQSEGQAPHAQPPHQQRHGLFTA